MESGGDAVGSNEEAKKFSACQNSLAEADAAPGLLAPAAAADADSGAGGTEDASASFDAAAEAASAAADGEGREVSGPADSEEHFTEQQIDVATESPAAAAAAAAAAVTAAATAAAEGSSVWNFLSSEWGLLPLSRMATLFIESFAPTGSALQEDNPHSSSSKGSSSRGSSSRGSSRKSSRSRCSSSRDSSRDASRVCSAVSKETRQPHIRGRTRKPRMPRKEAAGDTTDSSFSDTVESCCSCCSSSPCCSSTSSTERLPLLGCLSSRRLSTRMQRLRLRLSHQRLASRRSSSRRASTSAVLRSSSSSSSSSRRYLSRDSLRETSLQWERERQQETAEETTEVLPSLENWMGSLHLDHVPLETLIIPATHNSASWRVARLNEQQAYYCRLVQVWVSCQQLSIYEQLRRGIRWLDLRCCKSLEAVTLSPLSRRRIRHRRSAMTRYVSSRLPSGAPPSKSPHTHKHHHHHHANRDAATEDTEQQRQQQQQQASGGEEDGRSRGTSCHRHQHHSRRPSAEQQAAASAAAAHRGLALATGARRVVIGKELEEAGEGPKHQAIPFCAHGGVLTVPLMRVLDEVCEFLTRNPTEVVFLSCVPDEGVVGETFCRLKEISASEVFFCVASSLGEFLGPSLQEGMTLSKLVQRGQRVILLWSHRERCLPETIDFACQRGENCSCRAASGGRRCYSSFVADWVEKVRPIFAAANRPKSSAPGLLSRSGTLKEMPASAASGSDTASTRGDITSNGSGAAQATAAACNEGRAVAAASFVPSPFKEGGSRLFKSFYRTGTLHPEELIQNLLRWTSEEQRAVAIERRVGRRDPPPNAKHPITFRMLCGEVTAPRQFGALPFLTYWFGQGVAVWKEKPAGIKSAAKETNKLLHKALLRPLLQQVQAWASSRFHTSSASTDTEGEAQEARGPLDTINAFSHDFADRRIVEMLLRINWEMHCNPGKQSSA